MAKNIISVCLIVLFSCLSTSAQELNSASAFQGTWNGTIKTIAYAEKQNITMEIKVLKEIQVIFGVEGQKKKIPLTR